MVRVYKNANECNLKTVAAFLAYLINTCTRL